MLLPLQLFPSPDRSRSRGEGGPARQTKPGERGALGTAGKAAGGAGEEQMSRQIKGPDTWLSQLSQTPDSIKPGARQLLRPLSLLPFLGTGSAELFLHSPRVSLSLREMLFLRRAL